MRSQLVRVSFLAAATGIAALSQAGAVTANYTVSGGGTNNSPLNGLSAAAKFFTVGTSLTIDVCNTSTGVPAGFDNAASLIVTLGFDLPAGATIAAGNSAVIAAGSTGIGSWSSRTVGSSVAENWLWSNNYGGDLLNNGQPLSSRQIISTSQGTGAGPNFRFDGGSGTVNGPSGGIAAAPLTVPIGGLYGVSNKITFNLVLSRALSDAELAAVAQSGVVEFGSDVRYLIIPSPGAAAVGLVGLGMLSRRRRR